MAVVVAELLKVTGQVHLGGIAILVAAIGLPSARPPAIPQGVWLMDGQVAVQIFDCAGQMCGRIVWMVIPRDPQGLPDRDKHNPVAGLRQRKLCGLTIIKDLRPAGSNRWEDGWFYNPRDGKTYQVRAQLKSDDVIVSRIYVGVPVFGKTKILTRVAHETKDGWC